MQSPGKPLKQQHGVALITALLIVALATIISVSISTHLQLDVRRTGNILASEQAMLYTLFGEKIARIALQEDRQNNDTDDYDEEWAIPRQFPLEGGQIRGQLTDLQACINLNTLYSAGTVNPLTEARFRRLLANQQATANQNPDINLNIDINVVTLSIIDWIDDDLDQTSSDGAEDIYYMNLERPYRTANSPIQSISELRVIRGFEESKTYDALINNTQENLVCAFGIPASINVNTAPAEVLESLAENINGQNILQERKDNGAYSNISDFINRNNLQTIEPPLDQGGLSVSTEYFLLETEAIIGQARTLMYSIIQRDNNGETTVISRTQGAY